MEDRFIWFKGEFGLASQAKISIFSPTAQYGLNVFEGIRGYWNEREQQLYLFRLKEHFARLVSSCKILGLPLAYDPAQLEDLVLETVRKNKYQADLSVRVTVIMDGEGSWSSTNPTDLVIAPLKKSRGPTASIKGLSACVSTWTRISDNSLPPRIKAGANYINGRYGHLEAERNGYNVAIFLGTNGKVSEGAGSCLFMVRNGVLVTPTLTSSVLESITRATLFTLAHEEGVQVQEREIDRTELYLADELFLCGSAVEVTPITSIDRMAVGDGRPGPVTQRIFKKYLGVVSHEEKDLRKWLTPVY